MKPIVDGPPDVVLTSDATGVVGLYSSAIADRSASGSTVRPSMSRIKTSPRAVRSHSSKSLSASTEVGVTMVSDPVLT